MDAYDLSHKLAYAGRHSPIPFTTGPEFINSVLGVPVLSMLRIFIAPEHWSDENIRAVSRDIAQILGPTEQFDVGLTLAGKRVYEPNQPAFGVTARLTKLEHSDRTVLLRITDGDAERVFSARYPRLEFQPVGDDFWQSVYAPGTVKQSSQP